MEFTDIQAENVDPREATCLAWLCRTEEGELPAACKSGCARHVYGGRGKVLQTVKLEAGHAAEYAINYVQQIVYVGCIEESYGRPAGDAKKLYHI